jgi:hypothetical protein
VQAKEGRSFFSNFPPVKHAMSFQNVTQRSVSSAISIMRTSAMVKQTFTLAGYPSVCARCRDESCRPSDGGGEGKTSGGGHPVSPWGQKAKGLKTRKRKKQSSNIS